MNIKIFQKLQFEYLITYLQQCKLEVVTKHATDQSIIYKRNCLKANSQYTGCPTIEYSLCFCYFAGFYSS